ncbi:MAG TPA: MFS transporter [Candidatus Limnocylindrales bacterium]|nr:MFS transporter [Candidatus Limnocylindrales bacterium]
MTSHPSTFGGRSRPAARRRAVATLVAGVALGSTGHIAAATVASIVADEMVGTSALSGAPGAALIVGAAIGASLLSALMARRGRRPGIAAGYAVGVAGAFVAIVAIVASSLPLLLVGTVLVGFGNSANQLSRYVAADMFPAARRASAIGTVVWAATIGAVLGPNLIGPAGVVAEWLGLPRLAGAYLVPIGFVGLASILSFVLLRPDPFELADPGDVAVRGGERSAMIRDVLRQPSVAAALVALVASQAVMVLIMTMTPVHMTAHGHHVESIGLVISGHTFGMFALAPISGRLSDRFGSGRVILAGLLVLAGASLLAAVAPPDGGVVLFVALFLLGFGWNLGFVAGSTLLTRGVDVADRTRVQGLADSLIWSSAAVASLGSGIVLAFASFTALGLLGCALVILPLWLVVARRRAIAAG